MPIHKAEWYTRDACTPCRGCLAHILMKPYSVPTHWTNMCFTGSHIQSTPPPGHKLIKIKNANQTEWFISWITLRHLCKWCSLLIQDTKCKWQLHGS